MKITFYLTVILLSYNTIIFSQSVINYQAGTTIEVQTGADICADNVIINGTFTGGGTICGLFSTLNLTAFIEGFYNPASNIMVSDTVKVYLRNETAPYALVDSTKSLLNSSGTGTFTFSYPSNGVNYFVVIMHRNSIETWSSTGNSFTSGSMTYNFSNANTQAYGDNMIQVDASPVRFAIYSGDVNQDGVVDGTDGVMIDNDAANFNTGYLVTDLNGDEVIDGSDAVIADNNAANFVSAVTP